MSKPFFFDDLNILVIDDQLGDPENDLSPYFAVELEKSLRAKKGFPIDIPINLIYISKPEDIGKTIAEKPIDIILLDLQFKIEENGDNVLFLVKGKDHVGYVILEYLSKFGSDNRNLFIRHTPVIIYTAQTAPQIKKDVKKYKKNLKREYVDFVPKHSNGNFQELAKKISELMKRFYSKLGKTGSTSEFEDCMVENQLRLIYTRAVRSRINKESNIFVSIFFSDPGNLDLPAKSLSFSTDPFWFHFTHSALNTKKKKNPSISMVFPQDRNYMNYNELKLFLKIIRKTHSNGSVDFLREGKIETEANYSYVRNSSPPSSQDNALLSPHSRSFLGTDTQLINPFILAATPLTGYSFEDEDEKTWKSSYLNKLLGLIQQTDAGGIILKTVYREKIGNNSKHTPSKSVHSARGYHRDGMIYNTGKTKRENVSPMELGRFLEFIVEEQNRVFYNRLIGRIILSFGSHKDDIAVWEKMFADVFVDERKGEKNTEFKIIEINARHAIRGINKRSRKRYEATTSEKALLPMLMGVDEYFVSPDTGNYMGFWYEFEIWLGEIQEIAVKYEKKLIIKLPFRSDLNILAYIINKTATSEKTKKNERDTEFGIRGITVINTVKSPFGGNITFDEQLSEKLNLGFGMGSGDFINLPQLSGTPLKFLRNLSIYTVYNIIKDNHRLELSASGGIMDRTDIDEVSALGANTVQLSTMPLLDLKKTKKVQRNIKGVEFSSERCVTCEMCLTIKGCNAIALVNERIEFNEKKCLRCGDCTILCPKQAFTEKENRWCYEPTGNVTGDESIKLNEKYFNTRNIKEFLVRKVRFIRENCISCGRCVGTGYCDAIFNKFAPDTFIFSHWIIPDKYPLINHEKCTGCGMCISVCEHGALILEEKLTDTEIQCPVCRTNRKRPIYYRDDNDYDLFYCRDCSSILKNTPASSPKIWPDLLFEKILVIQINNNHKGTPEMKVTLADCFTKIKHGKEWLFNNENGIVKMENEGKQIFIQCRGVRNLLIISTSIKEITCNYAINEIHGDNHQWRTRLGVQSAPIGLNGNTETESILRSVQEEGWRLLSVYNNDSPADLKPITMNLEF